MKKWALCLLFTLICDVNNHTDDCLLMVDDEFDFHGMSKNLIGCNFSLVDMILKPF